MEPLDASDNQLKCDHTAPAHADLKMWRVGRGRAVRALKCYSCHHHSTQGNVRFGHWEDGRVPLGMKHWHTGRAPPPRRRTHTHTHTHTHTVTALNSHCQYLFTDNKIAQLHTLWCKVHWSASLSKLPIIPSYKTKRESSSNELLNKQMLCKDSPFRKF